MTFMKLYRVTLRGMSNTYGVAYVVAPDPTSAYERVRDFLEAEDIGFADDRELLYVELLADERHYNRVGRILYLPKEGATP